MKRRLGIILIVPFLAVIALTALAVGILQTAQIDELQLVQAVAGSEPLPGWLISTVSYLRFPLRLVFVVVVFFLAWLITRISWRLAGWLLRMARHNGAADVGAATAPRERRRQTVQQLVASFINVTAFASAFILAAGQFVNLVNLAVVATIVANALGFAARDYVGDFLNGISNIFEHRFDVGDNVAVFKVGDTIEGTVEGVTVRTVSLRTRGGELIVVPQGEVRILRNYSRGRFTGTVVSVHVAAADLPAAMAVLLALAEEAPTLLPDLLEPWKIIAQDGELGASAELLLHAKAQYGRGAELRLRIMTLVAERLAAAGVGLAG